MKVRRAGQREEQTELQMTPMIDIVFQLLVFFIMTFKIATPEGDFNIKMPLAAPSEGLPDDEQLPPIKVRMTADQNGELKSIVLGANRLRGFRELNMEIRDLVGDERGPGSIAEATEIELDCDYNLHYKHVIEAVTAVSGYVDRDNNIIKLVEKIKFSPPRPPPG
jgi:biopolymer transport protein ExbD